MKRRLTPVQANYPVPDDFVTLARQWRSDAIDILLQYIWKGSDRLRGEDFDVTDSDENLEDEITFAVHCRIQDTMPRLSPFCLVHQPRERERRRKKGQPPTSDIGFRLRGGNIRSHFTVEAKLIRTEGAVSRYINEIRDNLLTGRYSMLSSEAVMLGYLLSGSPDVTFEAIATSLASELKMHPKFSSRSQRYSDHNRTVENTPTSRFRCHHLLITFAVAAKTVQN
jgi:hypothetical protein